jgi:hypothetical protein
MNLCSGGAGTIESTRVALARNVVERRVTAMSVNLACNSSPLQDEAIFLVGRDGPVALSYRWLEKKRLPLQL